MTDQTLSQSAKIASDIIIHSKYARYLKEKKRRETWDEIVDRNALMHVTKFPELSDEIWRVYNGWVRTKKVLPSARSLQFAGDGIRQNNARMFNCFGRETRFVTSTGMKAFTEFEDGDEVVVMTHVGRWKNATVRNYGRQKLNRIEFARCQSTQSVRATSNHRWLLRGGNETTNLKEGNVIRPIPNVFGQFDYDNASPLERLYWCYGMVYGDGTLVKSGDHTYSMIRLCNTDSKYACRFEEVGFSTSQPLSCKGDFFAYTGMYDKTAPDPEQDSPEMIRAFVAGYLCADGSKSRNTGDYQYKGIQSSQEDHIEFIRSCFPIAGVHITNEKELTGEITNFGTRPYTVAFGTVDYMSAYANACWSVRSIQEDQTEGVWCLEVEDDHSFILEGGIVTGNCGYMPVDHVSVFAETMFLLLGGTGVGYSVQERHINKLPIVKVPDEERRYLIGDSIEGWADAVKVLMKGYFALNRWRPVFDYTAIRPRGAEIVTSGGKAPGPEPLRIALEKIEEILYAARGRRLKPIEVHRIQCTIADAVRSGGIRRAALICGFDADDLTMIDAKSGEWWVDTPELAMSNNSSILHRDETTKEEFMTLWTRIQASGSGEPGVSWTMNKDWFYNPCHEAGLRPNTFCNLTEINGSDVADQKDFLDRVYAATFIGTLQATYTDFHYLRPVWAERTNEDALLGVGITGIASGRLLQDDIDIVQAAEHGLTVNAYYAALLGINKAARLNVVKPAGTSSLVLGTSSGIHAWHDEYFIRRFRLTKDEDLAKYLSRKIPELVEQDRMNENQIVVSLPMKAPEGAITRSESVIDLLERVKKFNLEWVLTGHRRGDNPHNVSATINVRDNEWDAVGDWMWENRESYNGIAVLPFDGGTYEQAPFETIDREGYEYLLRFAVDIDLSDVLEDEDNTDLTGEAACSGGACEISFV